VDRLSERSGERAYRRVRTAAGAWWLFALVWTVSAGEAVALDVTTKVVVDNPADLGSGDIIMDGGTLTFTISPTLEKSVAFFGAKASTITAAPGRTVVFGPSSTFVPTIIGIGAGSTAVFGSSTDTGTIVIDTDFGASDPSGRVVVAGGTLSSGTGIGLSLMLVEAASTTVKAGATLNFGSTPGFVHNLKGDGRVITGTGGDLGLLVDDDSSSEFSGTISGGGRVSVMNMGFSNGTMILSGNNAYTGGTYICVCSTLQLGNGGTSGSIRGNVLNGGTLAFNRSDIYVFTGEIEDDSFDPGYVVQMGSGTTVLTANNTYTGDTTVKAGKLVVDGSIAGSHTYVLDGATLGGIGILGDTTVRSGGTHAPGNSIGTQTVSGNYQLNSGAILEIEASAAGTSDKVIVNGTVSLTGAVLRLITTVGGAYALGDEYLVIDNDGADPVTGTFSKITSAFAFLAPTASYTAGDGNDVVLTLKRNATPFSAVAKSGNQRGVGYAIGSLPDTDPVVIAVLPQTEEDARVAFDALAGEVHATLGGLLLDDSRFVREALLARMARMAQAFHGSALLGAGGPTTVAALNTGRMALGMGRDERGTGAPVLSSGLAFWTHGYGSWAETDGDGNASAAERKLGGFVSGMDAALGGAWRAGVATGYEQSDSSIDERLSSADVESYHLAVYAGGPWGALALRSGAAWTWHDIDTSRAIAFPGFLEHAEASYGGDTGQIFGEAALPLSSGRLALEPFAGLAYVSVETDSFAETGSSGALRSSGADTDTAFSTLGLRGATKFNHAGYDVTPRISVAWRHTFDDSPPGITLSFVSGSSAFGINGLPIAENSALIEAGLDVSLSPNATLGLSYSGQLADGADDHGIKGSLLWQF